MALDRSTFSLNVLGHKNLILQARNATDRTRNQCLVEAEATTGIWNKPEVPKQKQRADVIQEVWTVEGLTHA